MKTTKRHQLDGHWVAHHRWGQGSPTTHLWGKEWPEIDCSPVPGEGSDVQGSRQSPNSGYVLPTIQRRDRVEAAVATAVGRLLAGDVVAG